MDLEQMLARFVTEFEKSKRLAHLRARRKACSFVIGYSPFVAPTIPHEIRANHSARFPSVYLELRRASSQELTDSLIADACQACVMVRPAGRPTLSRSDPVAFRASLRRMASRVPGESERSRTDRIESTPADPAMLRSHRSRS